MSHPVNTLSISKNKTPYQKTPEVSVVIPLYNKAHTIQRAIQSVLTQSFPNFELIIVNDGSTDNYNDALKNINDSRIIVLHQINQGPGAARNTGLRHAQAEFISFLDADDELMPTFLERGITILKNNTDCALVCTGWYVGENKIDYTSNLREHGIADGPYILPTDGDSLLFKSIVDSLPSSAIIAHREKVLTHGGFYEKNHCTYGEDSYLWIQFLLSERIYRLSEPLSWMHSEDSELGAKRKTFYPLQPILTEYNSIMKKCPPHYKNFLKKLYSLYIYIGVYRTRNRIRLLGKESDAMGIAHQAIRIIPHVFSIQPHCITKYAKAIIRYLQLNVGI